MDTLTGPTKLLWKTTTLNQWDVRWRPLPDPRLRLFCLPYAGGGASVYRPWAQHLAPDIEVVAIRLPGRENRFREQPFTRLGDIVAMLLQDLAPWLDRPHAWFGHSMGALVAFEVCNSIRRAGLPEPARLLISGRPAPHLTPRHQPVHEAALPELVARLREMNGTPPEVLNDPEVLGTLVPTLRADFAVTETYHHRPSSPLRSPISVFGGVEDPFASEEELDAWRVHTVGECIVRMLQGDHFYFHGAHEQLLQEISADLLSAHHRLGP